MHTSQKPGTIPHVTRRGFMKAGGAAIAGLTLTGGASAAPLEKLALEGGPKSVTVAEEITAALTRWPRYGDAEKQALHALIDNNKFYDELPLFEDEWKAYTGSPFVKAHMNGSSALTSMYFALDLPPGSEVMVPSYTFFSACLAMRFSGLVPIFVDIDPKTACFDLEDAKRKLTPRTKAVEVMHSWGLPCDMDRIWEWCNEKGLITLEDAAHAHGAAMQGKKIGTWGDMAIFSFQTTKVMPCVEGGMGMYKTREFFERAAAFGHYEDPVKFAEDSPVRAYEGTGFGQKYRMHPFAAAVCRQQLQALDTTNAMVDKNIRALNDELVQLRGITEPHCREDQERVYYYKNMLLVDFAGLGVARDKVLAALKAEGVQADVWDYPEQHKLKIYSEPQWWHHPPTIPESMPGNAYVNGNHIFVPIFYGEAPELIAQYVNAFQKVWSQLDRL
ncbi:MAG: DegT/DnrJ/EryC1/StrS family aminotransferase [Candidatus Hydrogenedentes bacterium]|nr:DegT/DnrJ/EryC1/StrS family aminotransferase [Candidatus Hydrogenedentota bacterium]